MVSINFPQPPVMLKGLALQRELCSLLRLSHCLPEHDSPFMLLAMLRTFSVLQMTNVHQAREVDGFSVLLLLTRDFLFGRDFLFVQRWKFVFSICPLPFWLKPFWLKPFRLKLCSNFSLFTREKRCFFVKHCILVMPNSRRWQQSGSRRGWTTTRISSTRRGCACCKAVAHHQSSGRERSFVSQGVLLLQSQRSPS